MRHHYVPQFLLAPWATPNLDGKLEVFRLDMAAICSSRHTPKHTAYEENLYALTKNVIAGMDKQAIEKSFLMRIDNSAARVREKLEKEMLCLRIVA